MRAATALILGLAALGRTAQIPRHSLATIRQSRSQLGARDLVDGCPNPNSVDVDSSDPASFTKAGAHTYLDAFLKKDDNAVLKNSTSWIKLLDQSTSFGGGFSSQLDCTDVSTGSCAIATVACKDFTPHEVWWVRGSAVNVHNFFAGAFTALTIYVQNSTLHIDSMVKNFDVGRMDDQQPSLISEILKVFSPFGSIIDKSNKLSGGPGSFSDKAGLVGAIIGLGGAAVSLFDSMNAENKPTPPTPAELAALVGDELAGFYTSMVEMIKETNKQIFMGKRSEDKKDYLAPFVESLKKIGANVQDDLHPIAQIFGSGVFVPTPDGNFIPAFQEAMNLTGWQLAATLLASQKVVAYENLEGQQKWCTKKMAYWTGNSCFTLKKMEIEVNTGAVTMQEDIPDDIVEKWEQYHLDWPAIYNNVKECNNRGTPPDYNTPYTGEYPPCAFALTYMQGTNKCPVWPGPKGYEFTGCISPCTICDDGASCESGYPVCPHWDWWVQFQKGQSGKTKTPVGTIIPRLYTNLGLLQSMKSSGCIVINDSPRCQGGDPYNPNTSVTIYGNMPSDTTSKMVTPGCQLDAKIPANYEQVYFGGDGCLYDMSNNKLNDQCCTASTTTQVVNPYHKE
ncbi:hypothetical protein BGZ63DRAFT_446111 [Mariannaea sp. PMI_226]|nr:hypothetical protein BGZ63DRAFT_446111 [Mariannaea sp. PMI_226]